METGDRLTIVGADWQPDGLPRLDTPEGQALVEPFIASADVAIIDNSSCLFDPEGEKDPTAWQPAQHWLQSLRRRGKAVIMAHHANRQGGARGHSKPEDALDILMKLARPDEYHADQGARFTVTFEKPRGVYGAAVAPFTAKLTPEGWITENGDSQPTHTKLLHFVRLKDAAGERVRSATAAITGAGVQKQAGLKAWAEMLEAGTLSRHPDGGFRAA